MYALVRLAQLIGLNAVPGFGFFERHWSVGTILALYWFENLLGSLLIALRIDIHRRLTHKRGHYGTGTLHSYSNGRLVSSRSLGLFGSFLLVTIPVTLVEGVFLACILFLFDVLPPQDAVDPAALRAGVQLVAAMLVVGFLLDMIGIGARPFFWIHRLTNGMLSRIISILFVIFIGMFAVIFFNAPIVLIGVFMALKTLIDISSELPESQTGEAPEWQLAIASLFGPNARARFAAYARDANREYSTYSLDDEQKI